MSSRNDSRRGGLSVRTLAIASAASALATYLVPMIWRPGTIAAAAAMPVIVALISEALSRPAEHVSQAGRLVRVPRRRSSGAGLDPVARRRMRLAVVTGVLAFLVVAVVITTTELVTGEAVSGSGHRTSLLGGKAESSDDGGQPASPTPATETPAGPAPEATVAPDTGAAPETPTPETGTPTPAPPAPQATPTPAPSVPPSATPAPAAP